MAGKDLDRSLLSHRTKKRTNTRESLNVMHVCVSFADGDGGEFISTVSSVSLKPGQCDILNLQFLPFCPGAKYCAVLLICPQVSVAFATEHLYIVC